MVGLKELTVARISGLLKTGLRVASISLSESIRFYGKDLSIKSDSFTFFVETRPNKSFRSSLQLGDITIDITPGKLEINVGSSMSLVSTSSETKLYFLNDLKVDLPEKVQLKGDVVKMLLKTLEVASDKVVLSSQDLALKAGTITLSGKETKILSTEVNIKAITSANIEATTVHVKGGGGVNISSGKGNVKIQAPKGISVTTSPMATPVLPGSIGIVGTSIVSVKAPLVTLGVGKTFSVARAEPIIQALTPILTILSAILPPVSAAAILAAPPTAPVWASLNAQLAQATAALATIPNIAVRH